MEEGIPSTRNPNKGQNEVSTQNCNPLVLGSDEAAAD